MTKYISISFVIMFALLCFSCSNRAISDLEVPVAQDQQGINNNNLDQFVDDVKPYEEQQKEAFYNDNSASNAQK